MAFILDTIIGTVGTILDRVIPDKNAAAKAKAEFELFSATKEFELMIKQIEVNKAEAQHASVFVAGWRPFLGWVCASSFAYNYVFYPVIKTITVAFGGDISQWPIFDLSQMMPILVGMLGIAGYRTYEKVKHVKDSNVKLPKPF